MRLLCIDSTNNSLKVFEGRTLLAAYNYDIYPEQEQIDTLLSMDFVAATPYESFDWNI